MPTPILAEYLGDMSREMRAKSAAIRRHFSSHRPSAGDNREDLVESFLLNHLPERFAISTGLVISSDDLFSNQADLLVVDSLNNRPLYAGSRNKLWPVEAVYALIEVKTSLTPTEIADAVQKSRRFKALRRFFCNAGDAQRIADSLFVLWGFEAPSAETFARNYREAVAGVPAAEQPDLIIVPENLVARGGSYLQLSRLGQPGSDWRRGVEQTFGGNIDGVDVNTPEVAALGENSLLAGYVWFDSWLRQAGTRLADPRKYLPPDLGPLRLV